MTQKTLVIITSDDWDLFNTFKLHFRVASLDESKLEKIQIAEPNHKIVVILKDDKDETTSFVRNILNKHSEDDMIICSHEGYINNDDIEHQIMIFSHQTENAVYKLLDSLSKRDIAISNVFEQLKKEAVNCTTLYLLHSFLPIDIDMQALADPRNKDKKGYLEKMYKDNDKLYKRDHYIQKLYDLWYLLGEKPPQSDDWKPSAEAKKVIKINDPNSNLLKVAGLHNGKPKESPIFKFLQPLDDKSIVPSETFKVDFSFEIHGTGKSRVESFHDWFIALDTSLRENA